ncbi:glycosyltransferase [Roseiflexus sp.]|uniref:glycosyltransferase n=1 Tax=Roseiflexus sp. TaxID=2562120 RepID=UPI00398B9939
MCLHLPPFPLSPDAPVYGYAPCDPTAAPAVSVITPYYNTGPIFLDTVRSVLRQSLQQWEWVIVNDGSDEVEALRVLALLRAAPDPRIRVLDRPHGGPSAARNAGVAASRAPLLFFLDSDDLLAPTALEQCAWSLASRPQSAGVATWCATFGAARQVTRRGFGTRHMFPHDNPLTVSVMLRRAAFERVGGFDEQYRDGLEDYAFWVRLADAGLWGCDIHEVLLWVRRRLPQQYRGYRWRFQERRDALAQVRRELQARYPQVFRSGPPQVPREPSPLLQPHALIDPEPPFANRLQPVGTRRVLLLAPWVDIGGTDRFLIDLSAGLRARGCRVSVCLSRPSANRWLPELQRAADEVFNLPAFLAPADYPRFLRYLVESRGMTTVLVHNDLFAYRLLPFLRAWCPAVPVLDVLHIEQAHYHGGTPRAALEYDSVIDLHVTVSHWLRQWLLERGADPARVEVCHINVDTQRWKPDLVVREQVRTMLGVCADEPVVVFVGRLAPQKRPRLVAEIACALRARGVRCVVLVVGDGPDRRWMERFVRRHGLERRLRLMGAVSSAQVQEIMAAGDILLLPSEQEGIATVLFEAMAMGVVPVAADVGGQRELVTPECGVLIPTDGDQVAQYVEALQGLINDRSRRAAMAQAARARVVEHFDQQQMIDRMLALFDRADELVRTAPRPQVDRGLGLATASLAIEYFQFREALLGFAPVRWVRTVRWSSAWQTVQRVAQVRRLLDRLDRRVYVLRREVMWRIKRALGKPYNP